MDRISEDAQPCAFPACGAAANKAYALDLALCSRHRALPLDDPAEFRRYGAPSTRDRAYQAASRAGRRPRCRPLSRAGCP